MFKTRLLSGIVLLSLMIFFLVMGGRILWFFMLVISLVGVFELNRVFKIENKLPGIACYGATIIWYNMLLFYGDKDPFIFVCAWLIILLGIYVFSYPGFNATQIMAAFFGLFYVSVMLSYIFRTRELDQGIYLVWMILICSWGSDTCAYCVGVLIGKHKMSPKLSPKKSIEGAIGGVIGSLLLTGIYGFLLSERIGVDTRGAMLLALVGGIGALVSMVGDLAASAIKRNYNIKDYGSLIPGHGGILDRFDSIIITAPIIYYLCSMVMGV